MSALALQAIGGGGGGGGAASLQQAYDFAPTPPQITVAPGNPFTLGFSGSPIGDIFQVRDLATSPEDTLVRIGQNAAALFEMNSTTQGFRPPRMTEAQRDAIAAVEGLVIYNTDTNQLNQFDESTSPGTWTVPGAGLTTLQGAYDNDPTGAQILLDSVPNPLTVQASVAGEVFSVLDVAGSKILEIDADPETVVARTTVTIEDPFINSGAANSLVMSDSPSYTAGFVGGGILSNGTVDFSNAVWIWALLQESKIYRQAVNPGFAAFTLFNALANIRNSGNFNLVQALTLNVGVTHARVTSGTSTVIGNNGVNFAPGMQTTAFGAVLTRTNCNAVTVSPTWSTVAGSTVNLGTIRGIQFNQPAQALFGSSAGTENMTAYYGLDFPNMTFGGASAVYSVVRSQLNSGTNKRFLDHTGNAASRLRGHLLFDVDNFGVILGASSDALIRWGSASNALDFFFTSFSDSFEMSSPAADTFLFSSNDNSANEMRWDFKKGHFGSSGAIGNQDWNFVSAAETVTIAGGYSNVLLTQGGNKTFNQNMSDVQAWTINPVSLGNPGISPQPILTNISTLTVGGMTTSNPGYTVEGRQSLNVLGGRSKFRSAMQYEPETPGALSAGDNDDYGGLLTGSANNGMRHWIRLTPNGSGSTITGIDSAAAQEGDCFKLTNVGTANITLAHQDTGSVAENRLISPTGADYLLGPDESCEIIYDDVTDRWRIIYGTGA